MPVTTYLRVSLCAVVGAFATGQGVLSSTAAVIAIALQRIRPTVCIGGRLAILRHKAPVLPPARPRCVSRALRLGPGSGFDPTVSANTSFVARFSRDARSPAARRLSAIGRQGRGNLGGHDGLAFGCGRLLLGAGLETVKRLRCGGARACRGFDKVFGIASRTGRRAVQSGDAVSDGSVRPITLASLVVNKSISAKIRGPAGSTVVALSVRVVGTLAPWFCLWASSRRHRALFGFAGFAIG